MNYAMRDSEKFGLSYSLKHLFKSMFKFCFSDRKA